MREIEIKCPLCGAALEERDGEFWCDVNKRSFGEEEVERNNEWRGLNPMQKVERFKALGADEAQKKYFLRSEQLDEARKLVAEASSVKSTRRETVMPEKASLISLARAVTDEAALCELIDNAIDAGKLKRPGELVTARVSFNRVLRTLTVDDDAGGMNRADMRRCFTLGAQKLDRTAGLIGRYGIGAKEAIYHFGRSVIVRSRLSGAPHGIRTIVSEDWLDNPDWSIDIQEGLSDIEEGTTSIEISSLEVEELRNEERLSQYLGHTYERLIAEGTLQIFMQGNPVARGFEYVPVFPPELYPRTYRMRSGNVDIIVRVMLIHKPADAAGMVFYAQGRRFAHLAWSHRRVKMVIDTVQKSTLRDHIRVEIDFEGPIEEVPINATKDDLRENQLLATIAPLVSKMVAPYFKAIPPLSQDGAIGFVNTITEAHADAYLNGQERDLGRVGDRSSIPTSWLANVDAFKGFLRERLPKEETPSVGETIAPAPQPTGQNGAGATQQTMTLEERSTSVTIEKASAPARYRAKIYFPRDGGQKEQLIKGWLDEGRRLGVTIEEE